ncbi:MAG: glycosyltransferase family 2 protein [Thermoproteota archaeon]|nr:glycosyltransferase family 2 protein [Thermoproteota archaeon]
MLIIKATTIRLFVLDNAFIAVAMFFWLSYVPVAMISVWKAFKNRKLLVERDLCHHLFNDSFIIFQITTRSATKTSVVKRGIQSITSSVEKVSFYNYQISVVTDDPQDRWTLNNERCEVVVVEKNYHTNAIKKARALQYAVEHRKRIGKNTSTRWIFHMDEESYVTPQTILALLKFIRKGKGVVSEGPIFYPLKFESANRLTAIAESVRPYACYDCVSQMTNPPPLHMHGSNLLIRSDIEDDIGWKFGSTLAEDQMFGYKVYKKYGQGSMGWHGGILLEQPPLNLKDHFFQRRRWFLGTMQNLDKFPRWHRYKVMCKSMTLFLGFASGVASTALMIQAYIFPLFSLSIYELGVIRSDIMSLPDNLLIGSAFSSIANSPLTSAPLELGTTVILLFASWVWLGSYQLGLFLNLRYSKMKWAKKVLLHLQTLFLCPVIGLVETFPAVWAIIEYRVKKKQIAEKVSVYDFYIINK